MVDGGTRTRAHFETCELYEPPQPLCHLCLVFHAHVMLSGEHSLNLQALIILLLKARNFCQMLKTTFHLDLFATFSTRIWM